jgi:hypothetical protein
MVRALNCVMAFHTSVLLGSQHARLGVSASPSAFTSFSTAQKALNGRRIQPSKSRIIGDSGQDGRQLVCKSEAVGTDLESPSTPESRPNIMEEEDSPSTSVPTTDTWELDFSSRPILDARGKKRWELLVCSPDGSWVYSRWFPNNKINSTQVNIQHSVRPFHCSWQLLCSSLNVQGTVNCDFIVCLCSSKQLWRNCSGGRVL